MIVIGADYDIKTDAVNLGRRRQRSELPQTKQEEKNPTGRGTRAIAEQADGQASRQANSDSRSFWWQFYAAGTLLGCRVVLRDLGQSVMRRFSLPRGRPRSR